MLVKINYRHEVELQIQEVAEPIAKEIDQSVEGYTVDAPVETKVI